MKFRIKLLSDDTCNVQSKGLHTTFFWYDHNFHGGLEGAYAHIAWLRRTYTKPTLIRIIDVSEPIEPPNPPVAHTEG